MKLYPIILSGGSGTRLWPLSRAALPKQLLPLLSEQTMLQETAVRLAGLPDCTPPTIVCNEEHRFIVAEQMRAAGIQPRAIVLEPLGRNTAPAAAIAALSVVKDDPDGVLLILPADHLIRNLAAFHQAIGTGLYAVEAGRLVTFGIKPTEPHTGYGYIQQGELVEAAGGCYQVARYIEKPDQAKAAALLAEGGYHWNSGLFLFSARRYLDELGLYAPAMLAACEQALDRPSHDLDFIRIDRQTFEACPADSIDYAVMERTQSAAVVPVDMGWDDIGSWSALWEVSEKDAAGNALLGDVYLEGGRNNYIRAESRMVAAVGVENLVIIETGDAVLVVSREAAQDVKKVVDHLKAKDRDEHVFHTRVYRPWGWYEGIDDGPRFQVKRIQVKPGASLSLQMHHHRAEHWVVVRGTARITRGDEVFLLSENQSAYIPLGTTHRLENPGTLPLDIVEVQSGSYLGEDDIVRFEDHYNRN
jgi:mannose-1-phosphate guanylyltransferase/mannose-6-phosphate isomerase